MNHSKEYPSCAHILVEPSQPLLHGTPNPLLPKSYDTDEYRAQRDSLEQILLQVRKLREGLVSNRRFDALTIDGGFISRN